MKSLVWCCLLIVFPLGCGEKAKTGAEGSKSPQDAAHFKQSMKNLHDTGIAVQNFHEIHGKFPPGSVEKMGKTVELATYHGWQTPLLPFVEQLPLYDRIDLTKPWDVAPNRALFANRIPPYENPAISVTRSEFAPSHYAGNVHLFGRGRITKFADIKDGHSHTMMAGEVSSGFKPWGHPKNWRDPARGLKFDSQTFGGPSQRGTLVLMADGSVRLLKKNTDASVLKAIGTLEGGEAFPASSH